MTFTSLGLSIPRNASGINLRILTTVMPKSRNLPMTTREPISDAKARVFIPKLELGLPPLLLQWLRRGAPNSGLHCLYRVFSREKFEKREFPGWEMVTFCGRVRCWVLIGFHFPGWPQVLIGSHFPGLIQISWAGHTSQM